MKYCRLLQTSSYSVGLAYELLVMEVLSRYSFQLKHTGGAGDGGQDFHGYLVLPDERVPVVGQCKCYKKPVGPGDVREFENVLSRKFQNHQSVSRYLGVMASQNWFSASALKTFHSSKTPMMFCQVLDTALCDEVKDRGHVSEVAMNEKARTMLGNIQVTWRLHSRGHHHRNLFLLNS